MSVYKLQRRGMRTIVARGAPVNGKVTLTLECGHTSTIGYRPDAEYKNANCRLCKLADAKARHEKHEQRTADSGSPRHYSGLSDD